MAWPQQSYFLTSIAPYIGAVLDPAKTNIENWEPICLDFVKFVLRIYEAIPDEHR